MLVNHGGTCTAGSDEACTGTCVVNAKVGALEGGGGGAQCALHMMGLQARGVLAMDGGTSSDPYCKVTLGKEKHRSKVGRLDATWLPGYSLLPRP